MIQQITILDIYKIEAMKFIRGMIEIDDKIYTWVATRNDFSEIISSNFPAHVNSAAQEMVLRFIEDEH